MKYIETVRIVKYKTQTKEYAKYLCHCGNVKTLRTDHVSSGRTVSCGCARKGRVVSHGLSRTPEYKRWVGIISRTKKQYNNKRLKCYEAIDVCDRWLIFTNFIEDMGKLPTPKHEIDRIDNGKGYSPENCRWVTHSENMLNQNRNGEFYREYLSMNPTVSYSTYRNRVKVLGWDENHAAHQPKMKNQFI